MICPVCKREDKKSTIRIHNTQSTCAYYFPFFDEEGRKHKHDGNRLTSDCECSEGHKFTAYYYRKCWCDWQRKEPSFKETRKKKAGRT